MVADSFNPVLGIYNIAFEIPPEITLSNGEPQITKMLSSQQGSNTVRIISNSYEVNEDIIQDAY